MKNHRANAPRRRIFGASFALASFALLAMLGLIGAVAAQSWPERPVKLLVPFAAGGNIDVTGRIVAARLSEAIGQQFVVENRVGGGGIIATEAVARAPADGYTLLWGSTNVIAIVPHIMKAPNDPQKDLAPVSALGASPQVLIVNASIPAKNVKEFVAYVKAQPNKLAYGGGGGAGSASNLIMAQFLKRAGLTMTAISYRGTAPAMNDLIAGHIPVMFGPMSEAFAQAKNPKVRLLAVSSGTRSPRLPDVPSIAESGFPGFDAQSWTGMLAPAGTPKPIITKIAGEIDKALKDPKFVELLRNNGIEPLGYGPEKFAAFIASEIPKWGEAVTIAGVKLQK
jgi:tripartite-type tricarboxylate transporter receptor subunit TctC